MVSLKSAFGLAIFVHTLGLVKGSVTVYYAPGQSPLQSTVTAAASAYTGAAAYNPTTLNPPPVPTALNKNFPVQLAQGGVPGLSIKIPGHFFGFSVEMSVADQIFGKNASFIQVPFLNLIANIVARTGLCMIRVGGNTQETAAVIQDTLSNGRVMEKNLTGVSNPTQTPPLLITPGYLQLLGNISTLININWVLGVPFYTPPNFQLDIVELGQQYLGEHLVGIQVGNEPDFYVGHGHRPEGYGPQDYVNEFGELVSAMNNPANSVNQHLLVGPNVDLGWNLQDVWNTGFVDTYNGNLAALAVERYPTDNCFAQFGTGTQRDPQSLFPTYLSHKSAQDMASPYPASTAFAQTKGKPFIMMETNTASCGGFAGISDVFGAALWGVDYAMTMAYNNFSGIMFHIGGQNVFYNPFTPPPTNQSSFRQWTVGPIYYSAIVVAEAIGASNNSQVQDLGANNGDPNTPAYAIYENGQPVRVLLVNFINDPSGNSDVTAGISIGGSQSGLPGTTPASVKVKYLRAGSVSQKGNYTWAGQTWGDQFSSDGRPVGDEQVTTVNCDQGNNVCNIPVFAPSVALVFLSDAAETEHSGQPSTTYSTTARTKHVNTATIDPAVLATSNGQKDSALRMGSTSKGSASSAQGTRERLPGVGVILSSMAFGGFVLLGRGWWA